MLDNSHLPVVFMFPGQGAQYYQMGRQLYESNKIFRHYMEKLDQYIKVSCGGSVIKVMYHDDNKPTETFDDILYTHPAIFMLEFALARLLVEEGFGFLPIAAELLFTRHCPLILTQALLVILETVYGLEHRPIRQSGQAGDPDIHAHC